MSNLLRLHRGHNIRCKIYFPLPVQIFYVMIYYCLVIKRKIIYVGFRICRGLVEQKLCNLPFFTRFYLSRNIGKKIVNLRNLYIILQMPEW